MLYLNLILSDTEKAKIEKLAQAQEMSTRKFCAYLLKREIAKTEYYKEEAVMA